MSCSCPVSAPYVPKVCYTVQSSHYSSAWRSCLPPRTLKKKKEQPFASGLQIPRLCQLLHSSNTLVQILPQLQGQKRLYSERSLSPGWRSPIAQSHLRSLCRPPFK